MGSELLMPQAETFLPSEVGYPDPEAPYLGLEFPVLQTCLFSSSNLLLTCYVTLGKSLPSLGLRILTNRMSDPICPPTRTFQNYEMFIAM